MIYRDEDFEHGMMCAACDHVFTDGEEVFGRAHAMTDDGIPVEVAVCQSCALTMEPLKQ